MSLLEDLIVAAILGGVVGGAVVRSALAELSKQLAQIHQGLEGQLADIQQTLENQETPEDPEQKYLDEKLGRRRSIDD